MAARSEAGLEQRLNRRGAGIPTIRPFSLPPAKTISVERCDAPKLRITSFSLS
jgi:hypothetical protein